MMGLMLCLLLLLLLLLNPEYKDRVATRMT